MQGYIKDFRKELNSNIWLMPPLYHRVWQYLKYTVNHQPKKIPMSDGSFLQVDSGQHLTSVRNIAKGIGWYEGAKWKEPNPKTISKILDWLGKQGMITIKRGKGNRQYTLITLTQWEEYQSNESRGNSKVTATGELGTQRLDINKNDKECIKNDNNVVVDNAPARVNPPQPNQNPLDRIADHFMLRAGKPGQAPRASNYHEIQSVLDSGVGVEEILKGIDQSFDDYQPTFEGDTITSFAYCKKVILGNHYNHKARKEAKNGTAVHQYSRGDGRSGAKSSTYEEQLRQAEYDRAVWGGQMP